MKLKHFESWPVFLAGFLAPVIGGQVSVEPLPLTGNLFSDLLGGPELPLCARFVLGALIASSFIILLLRKKVIQIPELKFATVAVLIPVLVCLSVFSSWFPYLSYSSSLTWILYILCLFVAAGTLGRRSGVKTLLWSLTAGGTVTAFKAISEYATLRIQEPTHRVFGSWNNPNALAGILAVLIAVSLGLLLSTKRLEALVAGLSSSLMLFALVLTQSKGGLLATGVSLVVISVAALIWKGRRTVLRLIGPVAVAGLLTFGSIQANSGNNTGSPLTRITSSSNNQEQSAGFRSLLWKGAVQLIAERPQGWGAGTYRFESARPGLTEQTYHAHQTWLQIAVEAGVLSLVALIALAGQWVRLFLRSARKWPWETAALRAGVLGAVVAAAIDGMIESNLIYVGAGVALFLILGAGLQLSVDGSAPEALPKRLRIGLLLFGAVAPICLWLTTATVEFEKAAAKAAMINQDFGAARTSLAIARDLAPADGEVFYLSSSVESKTPADQLTWIMQAANKNPSTKYLRALARLQESQGQMIQAMGTLERALKRDPKNLATLEQKYKLLALAENLPEAIKTAKELVAVEQTPYFKIRAIPELVPLETYDARMFLALHEPTREAQTQMHLEALRGYINYMVSTAPLVKRMTGGELHESFLGHSMQEVNDVKEKAKKLVIELRPTYGTSGANPVSGELDKASSVLSVD